jgi:hypothetical protein
MVPVEIAHRLNILPTSAWWADASTSMTFRSNRDVRYEILRNTVSKVLLPSPPSFLSDLSDLLSKLEGACHLVLSIRILNISGKTYLIPPLGQQRLEDVEFGSRFDPLLTAAQPCSPFQRRE